MQLHRFPRERGKFEQAIQQPGMYYRNKTKLRETGIRFVIGNTSDYFQSNYLDESMNWAQSTNCVEKVNLKVTLNNDFI